MTCIRALLVLLFISTATLIPLVDANALFSKVFDSQRSTDTGLYGASVFTQDKTGVRWDLSGAYGSINVGSVDRQNLMNLDSILRTNTMSEMLVAIVALRLSSTDGGNLLTLDNPLLTTYTPNGAQFTHPDTGKSLTPNMLLTHTSLLNEVGFGSYFTTTTLGQIPTGALDFTGFVNGYFFQRDSGVPTLKTTIWINVASGSTHRYSYSRANIALLAFYLDRLIGATTSLGATGLEQYITNNVLSPMSLSDTFYEKEDGSFPNNYGTSQRRVTDLSTPGTTPTVFIHPAKFVDVMMFSTALDISRMARELFLNEKSLFFTYGTRMKSPMDITASSATSGFTIRSGQIRQGVGIFYMDAVKMCNLAITQKYETSCPFLSDTQVWGYIAGERTTLTGFFCTDLDLTRPVCVTVTYAYYTTTGAKSTDIILAMAAVAFQEALGDKASILVTNTDNSADKLYGLWVFFGVVGVITFVLLAAYFTEYIVQPAPIAGGMPTKADG
eukprot:PhF_6_TR1015/c0_g1_i4/m.2034